MRRTAAIGAVALLALAGCQKKTNEQAAANAQAPAPAAGTAQGRAQTAAAPSEPLKLSRRPGLWEMKMTTEGMTQASRVCVDAATDAKLGITGVHKGPNPCSEQKMTKTASGYQIDTVCNLGDAGVLTNHAVMTGDPGSHYTVEMTTTTKGARAAQVNGTRKAVMEATWKGACPADMKPGDVEVGGVKFNAAAQP
ncbi:MAG: hypothetical protein KGO51_00575 [Alphaproteobacteria bacterium]|nr:hypothetical protein [Alphaproteobacteria bacterium]